MIDSAGKKSVIEATGPAMLDRALSSYPGRDVMVVADSVFCPLVDMQSRRLSLTAAEKRCYRDMVRHRRFPHASYAVHYWAGTRHRRGIAGRLARLVTRAKAAVSRTGVSGPGRQEPRF